MRPLLLVSPTSSVWTRMSRTSTVRISRLRSGVSGPLSVVAQGHQEVPGGRQTCLGVHGVCERRGERRTRLGVSGFFCGYLIELPVFGTVVYAPLAVLAHHRVPLTLQRVQRLLDLCQLGALGLLLRSRGMLFCCEQRERFARMVYPVVHIVPYLLLGRERIHTRRDALRWRLPCGDTCHMGPLVAPAPGGADVRAPALPDMGS